MTMEKEQLIRLTPKNSNEQKSSIEAFDMPNRLSDIEKKLAKQPAKIYDLAVLSSLLARCNVKNLTKETAVQIAELYNLVIDILEKSVKPDVVHNDPILIKKSIDFIDRIVEMSSSEGASKVFTPTERERVVKLLNVIKNRCRGLLGGADKKEFFVSQDEIETSFGLKIFSD